MKHGNKNINYFNSLATSVASSRTPRQKPDQKNRAPNLKLTEPGVNGWAMCGEGEINQ